VSRRFGGAGLRRGLRAPPRVSAAPDLAAQILAAVPSGWDALGVFLARDASDYTLVSGNLATWVNHGTGADATQGVAAARPTYSATAVNGRPGFTADGGDSVVALALDSGAATAYAMIALFQDTDTAARFVAGYGQLADACMLLNTNPTGAVGAIDVLADGTSGGSSTTSRARSDTSYPMAVPAVVTGLWDAGLSTDETSIRHAGVDVTDSRPNNSDNPGGLGVQDLTLFARAGGNNMTGALAAFVLLSGTGPISGATLTGIATIESLLAAHWGV